MKKIITLIFLFFAFISLAQNVVKNVDAENFKKMMTDKKAVLIDLRTNDEIKNKGKIKDKAWRAEVPVIVLSLSCKPLILIDFSVPKFSAIQPDPRRGRRWRPRSQGCPQSYPHER